MLRGERSGAHRRLAGRTQGANLASRPPSSGEIASANPNLPKDVVAGLVKDHILTLKPVIDAQAAGDQPKVYTLLRFATGHMRMIADPLAEAIVKQFPQKFGA